MGDEVLVKVIVTTYNRRDWAKLAIDSVLTQTHRSVHIVVVDDASADGTAELVHAYGAAEPDRITAIVKPANRGIGDSIRVGLNAGPPAAYVGFLNDDDIWYPSKLERQLDLLRSDSSLGLVFTEAEVIDEHGVLTGEVFSDVFGKYVTFEFEDALLTNHACSSTLVLRQDLATTAARSFPDDLLVWDYYLILLAAGHASFARLDEPLVQYRMTAGENMHQTHRDRTRADALRARVELFKRNPVLLSRLGDARVRRRRLALLALDSAVAELRLRNWGLYARQSGAVIRQRQARPIVWLAIHTLRGGRKPASAADSTSA